ncbi:ATP-binding protein [Clostridium sp. AM58-1XD]|uniref:ATP-binding protein n=1 Tax=Clostridium sp. AM58-1XD TaxID=2292307 RepID=UPI000E49B0F3|nr:ATP-binding protein [Clostridium sp. AM58-1XD]RGZ01843.1 response regulator [Clostridium sp. AM58-1XD]
MSLKLEQFMNDTFDAMYENDTLEQAVLQVLRQISGFFQADYAYLIVISENGDRIDNIYEWPEQNEIAMADQLTGSPCELGAAETVGQEGMICTDRDQLPQRMKTLFTEYGVRALFQYPVQDHGHLFGFVGICDCGRQREDWSDQLTVRRAFSYLSRVLSVFLQKTRQKERMERYQKQLEDSLKRSEQEVETAYKILDQISSGVVILKMPSYDKLLPVYGNLGQYRMLGIERTAVNASVPDEKEAELESQYFDDAFAGVHPDDMKRVRNAYKEGYQTDHFTVRQYRLLRGDGNYVWVNADLRLQKCTPEYKLFYATYTDVTEEHDLQMQLREALEQQTVISSELEKVSNAKTDFLSRMSHDIRTPMNAILGLTALAKNELDHMENVKSYLDKLESSGQFLMGLLNDILDISKIEKNAISLHPEPYEIDEFRRQVEALIIPQCIQKEIEFIFDKDEVTHPCIMLDKLRFNQIIFNLLNNAVKYTPRGGRIELRVRNLEERDGRLHKQIVVRDNGIGMSGEFQKHMYEPFTQEGRKTSDSDGRNSGLGLAIVKSMVELMGGTIQVKSEMENGTEFIVDLWVDFVPESASMQSEDVERDISLKGLRVLLCEDNELNTEIAVYLLENAGAVVDCAKNGLEAVERYRDSEPERYDVILMDIRMPVMDGLEAARNIRALKRPDAIAVPIFAMTANAYEEDIEMSRKAGMNEHLSKPIEAGILCRMIRKYTDQSKKKQME